jgi:hypothetical protein
MQVSLTILAPLSRLQSFSLTKRHDYGSAYLGFPWTCEEAKCLAAAWPELRNLELQLNVLDLYRSGRKGVNLRRYLITSHRGVGLRL